MKTILVFLFTTLVTFVSGVAQTYKPFILAAESDQDMTYVIEKLRGNFYDYSLIEVGAFAASENTDQWVVVLSSPELLSIYRRGYDEKGFIPTWRIAVTKAGDKWIITYPETKYWGHALLQEDFPSMEIRFMSLAGKIEQAINSSINGNFEEFGSENGLTSDEIIRPADPSVDSGYGYAEVISTFNTFEEASNAILQYFTNEYTGLKIVYQWDPPRTETRLFGFTFNGPMAVEDSDSPAKGNDLMVAQEALIPYECLVVGNKVYIVKDSYILPLIFPDLSAYELMPYYARTKHFRQTLQSLAKGHAVQ
jgi:hypothetical protein